MDYDKDELLSELEEAEGLYDISHKVLHEMRTDKRQSKKKNKNKQNVNKVNNDNNENKE